MVERVSEDPTVQGVSVDLDRRWLLLQRIGQQDNRRQVERLFRDMIHDDATARIRRWYWTARARRMSGKRPSLPYPGLEDDYWQHLAARLGIPSSPFIITVIRRRAAPSREPEWEFADVRVVEERRPVAALTRGHPVVRPLVGGVSVGPWGSERTGTLGGVIEDANGARFGLTCSHVVSELGEVSQPSLPDAPRREPATTRIGTCVARSELVSGDGRPCSAPAAVNVVDASLIQLDVGVASRLDSNLGKIAGVASDRDVAIGDRVQFIGRTSGRRSATIGPLNVIYIVADGPNQYCFRNLIELRGYGLNVGPMQLIGSPVGGGDSGSWVLVQVGEEQHWAGVAVAGDGIMGYMTTAQVVLDWATGLGYELAVGWQ